MRNLFAVLCITMLAGCAVVPYGTTTTTTVEKSSDGKTTTTTTKHERPAPPQTTTLYVPVPAYSAYPVYPVYPVVPYYYGPSWSVCINCRRGYGHWR
ncbi:MAG: hypothetical protein Q8P17_01320 [bacterium]|nr:hypothetical protein [bacterium]